jgi:hypothetical protein
VPADETLYQIRGYLEVGREGLNLSGFACQDRDTVPIENPIAGERGHALSRSQQPGKVQGICCADTDQLPTSPEPSYRPELANRFRQRELLARYSSDETSASDLAPSLEATVDHQ